MNLLPEIREQLLDAAFGAPDPRADAARRRPPFGHMTAAFSIVVGVVVAAVFLLTLHRSAVPPGTAAGPTSGPPAAWVNALGNAGGSVRQHDGACRLSPNVPVRNQRFLTTAPPRRITSIVPSLASPARGALRVTVRELRALDIDANGIYARYAWQGRTDGIRYYVVPAAVVGATKTLPARCYREEVAAFRREARRFPASQRAAAINYAQQLFSSAAAAGVAVITIGGGTHGGTIDRIEMLAQLKTDPALGGSGGSDSSTKTALLVSSAVASVTATYHAQSYPGRVPRTFSVTRRPVRNIVIFHLIGAWDPPQLTFRSSTGAAIGRTPNR
jgi:hypothetical protein